MGNIIIDIDIVKGYFCMIAFCLNTMAQMLSRKYHLVNGFVANLRCHFVHGLVEHLGCISFHTLPTKHNLVLCVVCCAVACVVNS